MALKVIGAGLGRTGTLSLKFALEHIGFGPCYHMIEVMAGMPSSMDRWLSVVDGKPDWDAVFDGYASSVDYPGCYYWREQMEHFPDAKVILTKRNPRNWAESVHETIFSPAMRERTGSMPHTRFFDHVVYGDFGDRIDDLDYLTDYFERWNANVIEQVPADRLLVFEARQGWEPLCAFLGAPVPDEPYPRVNSREDISQRMAKSGGKAQPFPVDPQEQARQARARIEEFRAQAFPA